MEKKEVPGLTPRQRECLSWVHRGYETKEIARELGLSPETVEMHIKNAVQRLGVSGRKRAARTVFGNQPNALPQIPVPPSPVMPIGPESVDPGSPIRETERPSETARNRLLGLPFPTTKGQLNELSSSQRLTWLLLLAVGVAVGFGAVLSSLDSLGRLL